MMGSKLAEKITVLQPLVELSDPHVLDDNKNRRSILSAMYEPLVERDQTGLFVPALAENWNVSNDARTWTFRLRGQVRFHNGAVVKAGDVVSSLRRSMDPALGGVLGTQGVFQSYLGEAEFHEEDDQTVEIVTKQPFADLADLLVDIPIISTSALDGGGLEEAGTGPYRLLSSTGSKMTMEPFADYWGRRTPALPVEWIAEPDEKSRVEELIHGGADIVSGISVEGKQIIEKTDKASLIASRSSVCVIFMFNLQSRTWKDRRLRQALNYALDRSELVAKVRGGGAISINGPLTPLHFGYDPSVPAYTYAPDMTRSLLSEAGYADGIRVVLDVPTILPDEAPRLARVMAEQYRRVGIRAEIKEFSNREAYAQMVRSKRMDDACCFDSSPLSTYRVFREKFHSGVRGPWWQGYSNQTFDTLIDQGRATIEASNRQRIYRQAYRIIRNDAPWLFLYSPNLYWGIGHAAGDWRPTIDGLVKL
jgi:peptide/nickel transport system substrate-binding protein